MIARWLAKAVLREVEPERFYASLGELRGAVPDGRCCARCTSLPRTNACEARRTFRARDGEVIRASCWRSRRGYVPERLPSTRPSAASLTLALSDGARGTGAYACTAADSGTVQALVPRPLDGYEAEMERAFGKELLLPALGAARRRHARRRVG